FGRAYWIACLATNDLTFGQQQTARNALTETKLKTQNSKLFSLPSRRRRMRNSELIEYAKTQMIDQRLDRLWSMIKAGTCRQDLCAGSRELQHVLKMNRVV